MIDGDDVLARNPVTGERDSRSEDRQLLLDAIGAATEKLVITYTGANAHSGQARPPAVPLAELLDALDATTPERVRDADRRASSVAAVRHSQRHARRAGTRRAVHLRLDGASGGAGAAPASGPKQPKFISGPLPAQPHQDVALADLIGFFKDPVKGFFRALEYTLPWDVDGVSDEISVDIDALEQWSVGDRMLSDMLRGMTPDDARQAEWRRGTLPPGQLGWRKAGELREQSTLLAATALRVSARPIADALRRRHRPGCRAPADGHGVAGVRRPAGLGHLLQARRQAPAGVVDSVAGVVRSPSGPGLVGHLHRAGAARKHAERTVLGTPQEPAVDVLRDLVAIYDAGRREPLPLPIKTSYAWACARHEGGDPEREASFRWKSGNYPAEDKEPAQVRAWGPDAWLSDLMQPLRPGEECRRRDPPTRRLRRAALAADAARGSGRLMERFDLRGPLPDAATTTVLEASAGTGKTFALAGLVTRYVAEGVATLDQMLLITFGRAASQELRDRVRRQITHAAAAFDDPSLVGDNQLVAYLLEGTDRGACRRSPTAARRAGRLRRRDDRHHPSVLPAGAEVAWRGG